MAPMDVETFDPVKALIDRGLALTKLSRYQCDKLLPTLMTVDSALADPEIGAALYSVLSSFTPESLKSTMECIAKGEFWL